MPQSLIILSHNIEKVIEGFEIDNIIQYCYNLRLSNKSKEKPCIEFTQENLMEFLVQYIYLIYTRLIVCTT